MKHKIIIRADGGLLTGLGHLVRCIALAQMLSDAFELTFFSMQIPDSIRNEIVALGFGFKALEDENEFFSCISSESIVVLDNYSLDSAYQLKVKKAGCKLVCIDDLHDREYYADLIINVSPGVKYADYSAQTYTRFALGLQYALLRPAFLACSGNSKKAPLNGNTLICLGGSDQPNNTKKVLKLIAPVENRMLHIITGDSYPYYEDLTSYIDREQLAFRISLYRNLDSLDLIRLMQQCGIAICSPSTISIEYLAVTYGRLLLLQTADNQQSWNDFALSEQLAFKFSPENYSGYHDLIPDHSLQHIFFDGGQKQRILQLFTNL